MTGSPQTAPSPAHSVGYPAHLRVLHAFSSHSLHLIGRPRSRSRIHLPGWVRLQLLRLLLLHLRASAGCAINEGIRKARAGRDVETQERRRLLLLLLLPLIGGACGRWLTFGGGGTCECSGCCLLNL